MSTEAFEILDKTHSKTRTICIQITAIADMISEHKGQKFQEGLSLLLDSIALQVEQVSEKVWEAALLCKKENERESNK